MTELELLRSRMEYLLKYATRIGRENVWQVLVPAGDTDRFDEALDEAIANDREKRTND